MNAWAWVLFVSIGLLAVAFVLLWRKAGRELRAMEQFDQRRTGIKEAQQRPPVTRPVRVK